MLRELVAPDDFLHTNFNEIAWPVSKKAILLPFF